MGNCHIIPIVTKVLGQAGAEREEGWRARARRGVLPVLGGTRHPAVSGMSQEQGLERPGCAARWPGWLRSSRGAHPRQGGQIDWRSPTHFAAPLPSFFSCPAHPIAMSFRQVSEIGTDEAAPSRMRGAASPKRLAIGAPIAFISSIVHTIRSTVSTYSASREDIRKILYKICKSTVYCVYVA